MMSSVDLMLFSLTSVVVFCGGCYFLIRHLRERVPVYNNTGYSKKALRLQRDYKVFSWALMTSFFLSALVMSFYQVFTEL
ncbi:MAG: hypothetical protein ACK5Y2_07475 [Bdellovibrionales bacterium]